MEVTTQVNSDTKIPFLFTLESSCFNFVSSCLCTVIDKICEYLGLFDRKFLAVNTKGFFHRSFYCFLVCAAVEFNLGAELPFNSQWISLFFVVTVALKTSRGTTLSWIVMAHSANMKSVYNIICIPLSLSHSLFPRRWT